MSDYIDTREGWREIEPADIDWGSMEILHRAVSHHEHYYWVREAPVPPLPTAPYTVIRVTEWSGGGRAVADLMLRTDGTWYDDTIGRTLTNPEAISSFEVLSEPRGVTAKALIDRMHEESGYSVTLGITLAKLAREFGVES